MKKHGNQGLNLSGLRFVTLLGKLVIRVQLLTKGVRILKEIVEEEENDYLQ